MCTGIRLKAADGAVVYGRTQEWGAFDLMSDVLIVPRNLAMKSLMPGGQKGAHWQSRHGLVGLNGLKRPYIIDGVNEKGLACGAFYLPGFAKYEAYTPENLDIAINSLEVVHYILSVCENVADVKEALQKVKVVNVVFKEIGICPPLHYIVTDPNGESLVIEYVDQGELKFYDNPLGVITNAPTFDWHLTNLRNYVNLSPVAVPPKKLDDISFAPLGAGSGFLGLPGDFTPPSRFVRAVAFTQTARRTKDGIDAVQELFRILDNFNIGVGMAEGSDLQQDFPLKGATQWTTAIDTKNLIFYYHTCWNRRLRKLDLKAIDFGGDEIVTIPMDEERIEDMQDITPQ